MRDFADLSGYAVYGCSPAGIVGSKPAGGMDVCCECCVFSGRSLCDGLITHPEKSYRLWCVVVCDLETSRMRRPWPALGRSAKGKKKMRDFRLTPRCRWTLRLSGMLRQSLLVVSYRRLETAPIGCPETLSFFLDRYMGQIKCPKMPATDYQSTLGNIQNSEDLHLMDKARR